MSKIKIIIFDLDGVLFDSTAIARQGMLEQYPTMTEEMRKELLTGNFHEEKAKLSIPRILETESEKEARKERYSKEKSQVPMYKGAKDFLIELKNLGYILTLNTSALDRNCLPMLENSKITELFDFIGTAEISKSKVEKFKIIKEKYGINLKEMLFITDTLGDIREADSANVSTIAVTWGAHDISYFTREEHKNLIKIVDSFELIRDFLGLPKKIFLEKLDNV